MCIADLDKLNLVKIAIFRLKPSLATAPSPSKIVARFKSGQNQLENNHLALLVEIRDTLNTQHKVEMVCVCVCV